MARVKIAIAAEAPLSIGTSKAYGGTLIETGLYIGGGQLRGALAGLKRFAFGEEQAELDRLLGTATMAGVNFPNCYLTSDLERPSFPIPCTAETCKRGRGFISDKDKDAGPHGVADTLLMQLAYDRVARDGNRWRIPLAFQYKCPTCGHRTESYPRVVEYRGKGRYVEPRLSTHRQTRVAINRARQTAEDGLLYSVRAIDEGSRFVGLMEIDDERAALAQRWLPKIDRLGGRTSRGFGRVSVTTVFTPKDTSLADRLNVFNEQYRKFQTELFEIAVDPPPLETRSLFTVNLRSDAVLRDELGLPTLRFDEKMLDEAFSEAATSDDSRASSGISLIAQFALSQHISGWQTAWQLPKEVILGAQMGGLYVFATDVTTDDGGTTKLIRRLESLQASGIGEMREDGYGQIVVCDPFHLEVKPV